MKSNRDENNVKNGNLEKAECENLLENDDLSQETGEGVRDCIEEAECSKTERSGDTQPVGAELRDEVVPEGDSDCEYAVESDVKDDTMLKIKKLIGMSLLLIATIFIILNLTGYFNVKTIKFDYDPKISEGKMFNIIGIEKGKVNIFNVNTSDIKNRLMKLEAIKEVKVSKHFPDQLDIDMKFNNIIGAVAFTNLYIVINDTGEVIDVNTRLGKLPKIEGISVNNFQKGKKIEVDDPAKFDKIISLMAVIKNSPIKNVKSVYVQGGNVVMIIDSHFKVKFGEMVDINRSFNNLTAIYEDLKKKNKKNGTIDVSNPQMPLWIPGKSKSGK